MFRAAQAAVLVCLALSLGLAVYAAFARIDGKLSLLQEHLSRQQQQQAGHITAGSSSSSRQGRSPAAVLPGGADGDTAFLAAAAKNISGYRNQLLRHTLPALVEGGIHTKDTFNAEAFWSFFPPIITCPPNRPLKTYGGKGDGSKLLCDLGARHLQGDCVIYSLGSNGNFKFEEAMLESTGCEIHTFDCTYNGTSISPGRHHYHPWCVGSGEPDFKSWAAITSELGHSRVDLLKMDIEGHEYPVLADFQPDDVLPVEISIELHVKYPGPRPSSVRPHDKPSLALVFMHLATLGFGAYSQEINPIAPHCCCEYTFMRVWPLQQPACS